jgi:large subunit ribosomal protein L10
MAITKEQKKEIQAKVQDAVKSSPATVFVNFHGLTVTDTTELRRGLREEGVRYMVAKKTIVKRVLEESGTKGDIPTLEGELAIAYGDDLIAPAAGVHKFSKGREGISILGGIFDGEYKNRDEMMEIATIPPLDVLRGMFANVINSPIQSLVMVLDQIAAKKS